jgi:hypothetical protein
MSRKYHVQKTDPYGKIYTVSYRNAEDYRQGEGNYPTHYSSNTTIPDGIGCLPLCFIGLIVLCGYSGFKSKPENNMTKEQYIAAIDKSYSQAIQNMNTALSRSNTKCLSVRDDLDQTETNYRIFKSLTKQEKGELKLKDYDTVEQYLSYCR